MAITYGIVRNTGHLGRALDTKTLRPDQVVARGLSAEAASQQLFDLNRDGAEYDPKAAVESGYRMVPDHQLPTVATARQTATAQLARAHTLYP